MHVARFAKAVRHPAHDLDAEESPVEVGRYGPSFERLQQSQVVLINIEAVPLGSTSIKVHPDGTGALKKRPATPRQIPRRVEHPDSPSCTRGSSHPAD
jgi:hypothetical protein